MASHERCEQSSRACSGHNPVMRFEDFVKQLRDKSNKTLSTKILYQTVTNVDCSLPHLTDPHANWTHYCPEDEGDFFSETLMTTQRLHDIITQKTKIHIIFVVKTTNLTQRVSKFPTARYLKLNIKVANIHLFYEP